MRDNRIELLAPAGSVTHLKAAVLAGADAVYIGGKLFGARAYADNLSEDQIAEALHYIHFHGRKLYLTVNTLMKEEELNERLYGFLLPYYEAGLDGVIVQDLGTASFIKRNFPGMEIHASTQMSITHAAGAHAAGKLGMTRVVPARELSLDELISIKKESGLELEVFIHGALCFCYSGQCLLSSFYGGRSGNRGRCAQPCRLPYRDESGREAYYLSPRDLCALEMIPKLVEAGIDSLKIEGRMKNVEYVAGVTAVYRKYLDLYEDLKKSGHPEKYRVDPEDIHILEELYCRGGFTDGYLFRHNGPSMMALHSQKNLGRKIGEIVSVSRYKIQVRISEQGILAEPGDILVIPTGKDQETVLTVPSDMSSGRHQSRAMEKVSKTDGRPGAASKGQFRLKAKKKPGTSTSQGMILTLNVPEGSRLKPGMPVYRRKSTKLLDRIGEEILSKRIKYPVVGSVIIGVNTPTKATLTSGNFSITIEGPCGEAAKSKPLTKEDVIKQFKKTGETSFSLQDLDVDLAKDCFMPLSALKQLRQDAYGQLYRVMSSYKDRKMPLNYDKPGFSEPFCEKHVFSGSDCEEPGKSALENVSQERVAVVYDRPMFEICLKEDFYTAICLPADVFGREDLADLYPEIKDAGKKPLLSLPAVMRHGRDDWEELCLMGWDSIYVHNINEAWWLAQLKGYKGKRIAGARFYQWNRESLMTSRELAKLDGFVLPLEAGAGDLSPLIRMGSEEPGLSPERLVYGRIPLMVTALCLKKTSGKCDHKKEVLWLKDSRGRNLPVSTHCDYCYNKIWSDEPIDLMKENNSAAQAGIRRYIFDFFQADLSEPVRVGKNFFNR